MVYYLEGTTSHSQKMKSNRSVIFAAYPSMANMEQSMRKVDELLEALGATRIILSDGNTFTDRLSTISGRIQDLKQVISD